ncbi:hypothetical protein [Prolixibacter sp. NT017]|uniref:hypothetical protein n=1 Tax=Prolixibacter sp. NT017 TaxID=2652390 RepID=UPI00127A3EBD|nr:hypothetical protein [Prolixibacter sp. NT017]GET26616.1 hypothetical protein NT017_29450 [Prolixibacter sp. NT017]
MKKVTFLVLLFITLPLISPAQEQESRVLSNKVRTIVARDRLDGWYAAFNLGYSPIDERNSVIFGLRGGWVMGHSFTLGLAGNAFISQKNSLSNIPELNRYLAGGYGGLLLEPILMPRSPVHLSFPVIVGAGAINYWEGYDTLSGSASVVPANYHDLSPFFVVEPGLEIEFNVSRFFRLDLGGTYRFTNKIKSSNFAPDVLQTWTAYLNFKFGRF